MEGPVRLTSARIPARVALELLWRLREGSPVRRNTAQSHLSSRSSEESAQ
jgi:hypothetical protein